MRRFPSIARCLMFAAMALVVLAQSMALASLPVAPSAAVTDVVPTVQPPCHQQDQPLQDSKPHAMPCCDEEGGCNTGDCNLQCYRAGAQFAGVPMLLSIGARFRPHAPPSARSFALTSRQSIPPLPPPIFA